MTIRHIRSLLLLAPLVLVGCEDPADLDHGLPIHTVRTTHDTVVIDGEETVHSRLEIWVGHSDLIGGLIGFMVGANARAPIHFDEEARVMVPGAIMPLNDDASKFVLEPADMVRPGGLLTATATLSDYHGGESYEGKWEYPSAELENLPYQVTAGDTVSIGPVSWYYRDLKLRRSLDSWSSDVSIRPDPDRPHHYLVPIPADADSIYLTQEVLRESDDEYPWIAYLSSTWTIRLNVRPTLP